MKYQGPTDQPFIHNADAFIPFSFGPANCVGKKLALQEMRMTICLMMQKLELKFAEGWSCDECERGMTAYLTLIRDTLPVTVQLREKA